MLPKITTSLFRTTTRHALLLIALMLAYLLLALFLLPGQPATLKRAITTRRELTQKVLSARLTGSQLDRTKQFILGNRPLRTNSAMPFDPTMHFLRTLTNALDSLGIELISMEPRPSLQHLGGIAHPYALDIVCSFARFVRFVDFCERSPHLITVHQFDIQNYFEDFFSQRRDNLDRTRITLELSTRTLMPGGTP